MAEKKNQAEVIDICGIVMPIGDMPPDYDARHWADVKLVLETAISNAGMSPQIVSSSFESDVIQSRIVNNLYNNRVVICDVSGLNPNVMFELGMRITFGKPVIIVTDNLDNIPFDTKIVEHLSYPADLHIHKTNDFQTSLTQRIVDLRDAQAAGNYQSTIATFGNFEIFEPKGQGVAGDKYLAERLDYVVGAVERLERRMRASDYGTSQYKSVGSSVGSVAGGTQRFSIIVNDDIADSIVSKIILLPEVRGVSKSHYRDETRLDVRLAAPGASEAAVARRKISRLVENAKRLTAKE